MDGINTLIKETPENSFIFFLPCEDSTRRWPSLNQEADTGSWSQHLGLPASRLRNKFLLFGSHLVCGIFVTAARIDEDTTQGGPC